MRNFAAWVSTPLAFWWLWAESPVPRALAFHAALLLLHAPWYVQHELSLPTQDVPMWCAAWILACVAEAAGLVCGNAALLTSSALAFLLLLSMVPARRDGAARACLALCLFAPLPLQTTTPVLVLLFVPLLADPVRPDSANPDPDPDARASACRVEYHGIPDPRIALSHSGSCTSGSDSGSDVFCMVGR